MTSVDYIEELIMLCNKYGLAALQSGDVRIEFKPDDQAGFSLAPPSQPEFAFESVEKPADDRDWRFDASGVRPPNLRKLREVE